MVKDKGAKRLARCIANIPDKQVAAVIANGPLGQRTRFPVLVILHYLLDYSVREMKARNASRAASPTFRTSKLRPLSPLDPSDGFLVLIT